MSDVSSETVFGIEALVPGVGQLVMVRSALASVGGGIPSLCGKRHVLEQNSTPSLGEITLSHRMVLCTGRPQVVQVCQCGSAPGVAWRGLTSPQHAKEWGVGVASLFGILYPFCCVATCFPALALDT